MATFQPKAPDTGPHPRREPRYDRPLTLENLEAVFQGCEMCIRDSPKAAQALRSLAQLKGCQAHCSVMLSPPDEMTYKKLGIQLTCEPQYQSNKRCV